MKTIRSDFQPGKFSWKLEGRCLPQPLGHLGTCLATCDSLAVLLLVCKKTTRTKCTFKWMVRPDFWWAPVISDRVSVFLSAEPQLSYFRCWKRILNTQDGGKEERKALKYLWSLASSQKSLANSGRGEAWIYYPSCRPLFLLLGLLWRR